MSSNGTRPSAERWDDIERPYTPADVEESVVKAKETPPYHPHTTPRKRLPVKY